MALDDLNGIANVQFGTQSKVAWETASDWDNNVDQQTVAHDSYGDLPGGGTVQLGYDDLIANETDLIYLWHGHDSSGPVEDVSGNGRDGSTNGTVNFDQNGILNGTSIFVDESYGEVRSPYSYSVSDPTTMMGWFKFGGNRSGTRATVYDGDDGSFDYAVTVQDDGDYWIFCSGFESDTNVSANSGTWAFIAATWDPNGDSRFHYYEPGGSWTHTSEGQPGTGSSSNNVGINDASGANGGNNTDGNHSWVAFLEGTALSDSAIENYGAADSGYIETATKSLDAPGEPDLVDLSYSLNSQDITIDAIGSPGTADEETVTQSLGGDTSYSLSWSQSHTDFRVKINLSTADITTSPTISRVALEG